jgi:hypothetical protein
VVELSLFETNLASAQTPPMTPKYAPRSRMANRSPIDESARVIVTQKEISLTDSYIHKNDEATSTDALDDSSSNQHVHVD